MPPISADCLQPIQGTGKQSHAIRSGLICAFVVAICLWASYPVAEMGFIDDWSCVKTAQVFAQTGHFVYNGWMAPILGWQVVWGALFIKLFGFSFTAVRLSMLPVAMATVFLFHAILLRFGVNSRNAALGALTLGLSPLFMPLAATYMTEVPGLFVILLCLYLCQRAVAAGSSRATIGWLCLAAATNVVGGTVRQIAWLGALAIVPSAGWLLRKRRGVPLVTSALWVLSVASIFACMRWFVRQPYSIPEPFLKELTVDRTAPVFQAFRFFIQLIGAGLCLAMVVYPILVAWLPKIRRLESAALLRIALITLLWGLFERVTGWTMPWLLNDVLLHEFAPARADLFLKPGVPSIWAREAISLLVVVTALVFVEYLRDRVWQLVKKNKVPWDIWWLLGPFSLCYFVLLLPRAYHYVLDDRYLLPMMPIAIICLLRLHQDRIAPTLPTFSVIVLAVFAVLAIGGTHDWFAFYRARLAAIDEIRASGIPRTAIQGGFEYDGWTQIEAAGSINGSQFMNDSQLKKKPLPECDYPFARYTPDVHPKFTTIFPKMWCLEPSEYPPVSYRTWLPPFKGTILIQKIPNAR